MIYSTGNLSVYNHEYKHSKLTLKKPAAPRRLLANHTNKNSKLNVAYIFYLIHVNIYLFILQ